MTLATLCDFIWVEIWDDVSPLADVGQWRDVAVRVFLHGEDPSTITWTDSDGKTHRLGKRRGLKPTKEMFGQARALYDDIQARKARAAVASRPDDRGPVQSNRRSRR